MNPVDNAAQEARDAVDFLVAEIGRLEAKIELAQKQADYGATHGHDAQDTLDDVLSALEGRR